ncbi:MAG: SDR family NAD(P)-dependent oxidoreductase [Stenotrophobium sp.]
MPGTLTALHRSIRRLFVRAPQAQRVDLRGRKIIVTGAARGSIGYETAGILASWGATLVVTSRSNVNALVEDLRGKLSGAPDCGAVDGHTLDLCDTNSVNAFVEWYRRQHGERLDVLINNAGVHLDLLSQWKTPQEIADGHEIHWRTNYLGTMQLTMRLLPLLQNAAAQTGDARIVNVVSMLHDKGRNEWLFAPQEHYNSWVAYGTSKLALIHASFELQRRYAESANVQAYCLHPGAVYTNIAGKGLAGNPVLESIRNFFAPVEAFFLLTPEEGAQTQVHCASSPDARGGLYYRECRPAPASKDSADTQVSARLWEQTQAWIGAEAGHKSPKAATRSR